MRPVLAGLLRYESLRDCTVNIADIAELNEALDVQAENERRFHEANKPRGK